MQKENPQTENADRKHREKTHRKHRENTERTHREKTQRKRKEKTLLNFSRKIGKKEPPKPRSRQKLEKCIFQSLFN